MAEYREIAPAKINLFLHITGKRPDDYHTLQSAVVFSDDLVDEIQLTFSQIDQFDGLFGQDNLIIKARDLYRHKTGWNQKFNIKLNKNIPVGAGLGGGSADAAAILRLLNRLCPTPISTDEMLDLCLLIGADVPCCYRGVSHIMGGIGEKNLSYLSPLPSQYMLLVCPPIHISTAEIFRQLSKGDFSPEMTFENFSCLTIERLKTQTRNDLYHATISLYPQIAEIITLIEQTENCALARMSGSGASCFGLYADMESVQKAAQNLLQKMERKKPEYLIRALKLSEKQFG